MSQGLLRILLDDNLTPRPYVLVADTAFPRNGPFQGRILTPLKNGRIPNDAITAAREIARHQYVLSIRQAAEWGMRAIQSTFSRLQAGLSVNSDERRRVISVCILLYNLRTEMIGINQIRTVFSPNYAEQNGIVYGGSSNNCRIAQHCLTYFIQSNKTINQCTITIIS